MVDNSLNYSFCICVVVLQASACMANHAAAARNKALRNMSVLARLAGEEPLQAGQPCIIAADKLRHVVGTPKRTPLPPCRREIWRSSDCSIA